MLGLGIQKFWNMRPKLPFRFKVQFYTEIEEIYNIDEILAISLTNINLPKMEGHAGEGSLYLGDTVYTIPVWSLGSRKLEITFEETDNMAITRFIDEIHNKSWRKNPYRITIIVHQFDEKMREDNSKPTRYSQSTGYVCHLCSFQEPAFKRDGNAGQLTVTATFIIDSVIENWDVNNEGKYLVAGNTDFNELNSYNDEIVFKDNSLKTRVDTSNLDNKSETSNKDEPYGYGGKNKNKEAKNFIHGEDVNVTRGAGLGTQKMTVNAAYSVIYDTSKNKMYLLDNNGNVLKEATAYTSNKGSETTEGGAIPKGTYLLNNDLNSHNKGQHTRERNGNKVNENAMTLYGLEGSAGDTLKKSGRAGLNLHYGESSNWSEGCAVTPDISFLKETSESIGNSNILFKVI